MAADVPDSTPPKTNSTAPVPAGNIANAPFIFNGKVISDIGQGSGVAANHPKTFFTAAHVLFSPATGDSTGWSMPPFWLGGGGLDIDPLPSGVVPAAESRGYFRWSTYAGHVVATSQDSSTAFASDIALAWGLKPFFSTDPATVDFGGVKKLKKHQDLSMITGFPMSIDYTGESTDGSLYATTPEMTVFQQDATNYLAATHISTGPGNSGGPVWVQNPGGEWKASGILVSGRPSEVGIYAFNPEIKSLVKAVSPLVGDVRKSVNNSTPKVSTSTGRYVMAKPKKIPDGVHKWTKIPFKVNRFDNDAKARSIKVDLTVTTHHVGDLMVALLAPGGEMVMIHNGEGATEHDLVLDNLPVSYTDGDIVYEGDPNGTWSLLVQDRLTQDQCIVTRFELEIEVQDLGPQDSSGEETP